MFSFLILLFALISVNFQSAKCDAVYFKTIRKTEYGLVRGKVDHSRANSSITYYSFKGIQFAQPALGKLRFQEAQPPKPWTGIQGARHRKQICLQFDDNFSSTKVVGSEDCLYLDIYIPITKRDDKNKMPVMVWIHGGNWVSLSPNITAPDYFMEKPVVIVEIGYRLNVFGFLTTLDDNAKGNLGLKDQVMALKWVQRNIQYFDGDTSRITIFGMCSGSASVFFHMVSPLSKGLFTQGIGESGSPLNPWAIQRRPLEKTYRLARSFGITSNDSKVIVRELQKIDADGLFRAAFNFSIIGYYSPVDPYPFATIIEKDSSTAFLSESAYNRLRRGDFQRVPLIMGMTAAEGSYAWRAVLDKRLDINLYQSEPQHLIPLTMNIPHESSCINKTLDSITKKYFPDGNYTNVQEWLPYMSLDLLKVGILETAKLVSDAIPVYFYEFNFVGSRTRGFFGRSGHTEELVYLWYPQGFNANPNETDTDRLTRHRMVTLWTNFAATGNPTPKPEELLENVSWTTVKNNQSYLNIGIHLTVQNPLPHGSDMKFWNKQYRECGFPDPDPNRS